MKMIRKKDIKTMIRASRTRPNLIIIARIEKHNPTGEQASLPPLSNADSIREAGIYSWKIFAGKMNNAVGFKQAKWGIARIYEIFARGGEKKERKKEETWFNTFANRWDREQILTRVNRDSVKLRLASHVPVIYANRRVYEIVLLK